MSLENPDFLKQKYDLHNALEVEAAVKRTEIRSGEKVPQNPQERIQNYLNRFSEIIEREDPEEREQGIEAIKRWMHNKFVIKPEAIPEAYFDNQKRLAREQGHGDVEITDEARDQLTEVIITDQASTLDKWVDYLASPDATYPDWLKYWATRSVLGMAEYDKEKKQFGKRSKGTTKPFPDLNREALAYVLDAVEKKHQGETTDLSTQEAEDKEKFNKLLQGENFAKLYAWAIEKVTPASQEALANTVGHWVKYNQGSDHMPLVQSLQGHGTGWCTAGESTAEAQLKGGDFYVYYSQDEHKKPIVPRVAIRMQENSIAEVRGIAPEQNMDQYITPIVQEKLKEFPDGAQYEKKTQDMKQLTTIDNKVTQGQELTKDDLVFLYEINKPIQGFGYQTDPRIKELIATRNPEADMPIVFECTPQQIAHNTKEINQNTKAFVGPLTPGIFDLINQYNIEHIYTSFPEGIIRQYQIEIGGKDKNQLEQELKNKNINISGYAHDLLNSPDFSTSKNKEQADLVRLTVKDFGFPQGATIDEIYQKAKELGLELCPAEVGPNLRLQYSGKKWILIAMKQISGAGGDPSVFSLNAPGGELELRGHGASPDYRWYAGYDFVFQRGK